MIQSIFVCALAIACVYADSCNFDQYRQCLKPAGPQQAKNDTKFAEIKAKADQCFTSSGCTPPQPKQKTSNPNAAKFEQARQCQKQVYEKVGASVLTCVQKKYPSFKFPEQKQGEHKEGGHGGHGFGGHKGGFQNFTCPNDQAKSTLKQCLEALKPANNGQKGGNKPDFKAIKQQICQKKQQCFQQLSATCQQEFNGIKDAVCQCAKSVITPQAVQLEASLQACRPQGAQQGKGAGKNVATRKPVSASDRLIQQFCKNDSCKA